jgi:hypothetical protein
MWLGWGNKECIKNFSQEAHLEDGEGNEMKAFQMDLWKIDWNRLRIVSNGGFRTRCVDPSGSTQRSLLQQRTRFKIMYAHQQSTA